MDEIEGPIRTAGRKIVPGDPVYKAALHAEQVAELMALPPRAEKAAVASAIGLTCALQEGTLKSVGEIQGTVTVSRY